MAKKGAGAARVIRLRPGLGTFIALETEAATHTAAQTALEHAWAAIQRVEALMHPSRPGSDVGRINAAGLGRRLPVDAWTYEVLELAHRVYAATGGIFDPCLPLRAGRLCDLELLGMNAVRARRPLSLDLGGIAKGYAVDRAVQALREAGCSAGLINAGGDLRGFGRLHRIQCPAVGREVRLRDGALAVSQPAAPAHPPEHRGYYRRDGSGPLRARPRTAAAVLAPTAALADALTKFVLLGPRRSLARVLRQFDARVLESRASSASMRD